MSCLKVDKDSFVELCVNRIKEVTNDKEVALIPDGKALSYSIYSPTGERKPYMSRSVDAIYLGNDLWMGFEMTWYDPNSTARNVKHCLHSINLKFYHKLELICRAEWECEDEGGPIITHPQPHWHFDNNSPSSVEHVPTQNGFTSYANNGEDAKQIVRFGEVTNKKEQVAENVEKAADNYDIVRMHFSISSKWPDNIMTNRAPQKNEILNWLVCCARSMKEQHASHYTKKN